jgi:hypothetical protein
MAARRLRGGHPTPADGIEADDENGRSSCGLEELTATDAVGVEHGDHRSFAGR